MRDHVELRAREPVARCLMRRLIVPRIYFEAPWPDDNSPRYDALALDRDGHGDAHVVEIQRLAGDALRRVASLLMIGAPYRWIAFLGGTRDAAMEQALASRDCLYAHDTAGRVGVIEVVEMEAGDLGATIRVSAERFPGSFYEAADAFADAHKADIQY